MNLSASDRVGPAPGQIKSKERVFTHGEVFTADREVQAMLDLVRPETERIDSRFLEPACGNGNFLARILERKLAVVQRMYGAAGRSLYELNALIAIGSLYGIEILRDNVEECRHRLYRIFEEAYTAQYPDPTEAADYLRSVRFVVRRNVLWGDALTLRTPDGRQPIVFSEWSVIRQQVKRRDFTLDALLQATPFEGPSLFSDLGEETFIPQPIREFPLTHYAQLYTYDEKPQL